MLLSEWAVLNDSFIEQPPVDLLVAAYIGYKSPIKNSRNLSEAARANSEALNSKLMSAAIPKARMKSLAQMPEYVRSPAKMELIEKMKRAMLGDTDG